MLPSPSFTNIRSHFTDQFYAVRSRATLADWFAKLVRRNNNPKSFVAGRASGLYGKRLTGVRAVRVDRIVGTIQRTDDFDKDFRPLKRHLRDRWVNARLRLESDDWEPVRLHKVGEYYFVKDGHHRVSVAKAVGMMYIEAEVWEHCPEPKPRDPCGTTPKPVRRREHVFSTPS